MTKKYERTRKKNIIVVFDDKKNWKLDKRKKESFSIKADVKGFTHFPRSGFLLYALSITALFYCYVKFSTN